jgi:hypothetical protein
LFIHQIDHFASRPIHNRTELGEVSIRALSPLILIVTLLAGGQVFAFAAWAAGCTVEGKKQS